MKKLLFLLTLLACSETQLVEYQDISGTWRFETKEFSGQVTIARNLDGRYAVESGEFIIDGKKHKSNQFNELTINGFVIEKITLGDGDAFLMLQENIYTSDFSTITSNSQVYLVNCPFPCNDYYKTEPLVLRR